MKIKFILKTLEDDQLLFQVLEMDERFRDRNSFKTSNGWNVISGGGPDLNWPMKTIFLQGVVRARDKQAQVFVAISPEQVKSEIIAALQDWAANWEGFEEVHDVYCI